MSAIARPLRMHGKTLSFAPRDITAKNFGQFEQEIRDKWPLFGMMSFTIPAQLFEWKHPLGSRVNLIKKSISVPGLGSKLSEYPLDDVVWIIKRRAVYLNLKNQLVKTVFLEMEHAWQAPTGMPTTTQQPENACVLV